jgi:general secretion pathway protein G
MGQLPPPKLASTERIGRQGFSLVEVVVVSGLVLMISLVAFQTAEIVTQREKEDRLRSALLEMRAALDAFHQDQIRFPDTITELLTTPRPGGGFYLRRLPLNPLNQPFPAVKWEISGRTSREGTTDVWVEITDPAPTIGLPIVDIRCPAAAGTGLNGLPYFQW